MANATQVEKARRFREMHRGGRILVLPNAWDAASARIFAGTGFGAVGTTSAGVAWALGYADGQLAPRVDALATIARIAGAVGVPVTADVERGLGRSAADLAETARGQKDSIAEIVRAVSVPVNVYAFAGVPSAPELQALGVARVSVGCGPMQATLGLTRRIAEELRDHGTWGSMSDGALSAREANAMMAPVDPGRSS